MKLILRIHFWSRDVNLTYYVYDDNVLQIGRWAGVDQIAERYRTSSPYSYALNNSVKCIDSDGRDVRIIIEVNNICEYTA